PGGRCHLLQIQRLKIDLGAAGAHPPTPARAHEPSALQQNSNHYLGANMKKTLALVMLATVLFAGPAFAADPIIGSWKLNVAKSTFSSGQELKAGSRVYTEADGVYTLEQKMTGADGKEVSFRAQYSDSKDMKQSTGGPWDTTHAKKVDANTWNFDLKKDGKVVGHVHRVVSADGKTLTVHNTGGMVRGGKGDQTLVYDKQ